MNTTNQFDDFDDKGIKQGSVYILSNPIHSMLKIGFTTKKATERARELYTTGVPEPFTVEYEAHFMDALAAEKQVHSKLHQYRYASNREFFQCNVETAKYAIDQLSDQYGRLDKKADDVFTEDRRHTIATNDSIMNKVASLFFGIASAVTFLLAFLWSPGILRSLGL